MLCDVFLMEWSCFHYTTADFSSSLSTRKVVRCCLQRLGVPVDIVSVGSELPNSFDSEGWMELVHGHCIKSKTCFIVSSEIGNVLTVLILQLVQGSIKRCTPMLIWVVFKVKPLLCPSLDNICFSLVPSCWAPPLITSYTQLSYSAILNLNDCISVLSVLLSCWMLLSFWAFGYHQMLKHPRGAKHQHQLHILSHILLMPY